MLRPVRVQRSWRPCNHKDRADLRVALMVKVENSMKIESLGTYSDNKCSEEYKHNTELIDCQHRRDKKRTEETPCSPLMQGNLESHEKARGEIKDRHRTKNLDKCNIDIKTNNFYSAKGDLIEDVIETIKGSHVTAAKTTQAKGIKVVESDTGEILVQIGAFAYSVDMEFASTKCKERSSEMLNIQDCPRTCDDGLSVASHSPASSHEYESETDWKKTEGPQYLERTNIPNSMEVNYDTYRHACQGQCQDYCESYNEHAGTANIDSSLEWPQGKSDTHSYYTGDDTPTFSHSSASMTYPSEVVEIVRRHDYYSLYNDPLVDSLIRNYTDTPEKSTISKTHSQFVEHSPSSVTMASLLPYNDYCGTNSPSSLQYETFKSENDYHVTNRDTTSPSCSEHSEGDDGSIATGEHRRWESSYAHPYRGAQFLEQYPYNFPRGATSAQMTAKPYSEDMSQAHTGRPDMDSNFRPSQTNVGLFSPTPSRSVKKLKRGCRLWEFIRNLLLDPSTNPKIIRWENREKGTFKLVQSKAIAHIWGMKKGNEGMNYEKLSRAMRYYYKRQIFAPVLGKRLVYSFGPRATGWRAEEIVA